mmetsp:Transcript_73792/g.209007  ORF Transcript_73792/g.209007 Transcript_73792/m.209007 type:complete len:251 (+) Transcript_73792:361-1113(+)
MSSQMEGSCQTLAPKRPMRWAPVILVQRLYFLATVPSRTSSSGVISPPGTRGMTEYWPLRCMFARKESLVSWSCFRPSETGFCCQSEARIEATTGLQTSSPARLFCKSGSLPTRAHSATTSSQLFSSLTRMISNSSGREKGKWGLMPVNSFFPHASSVVLRIFGTKPVLRMQPPQPLPAVVQRLMSAIVAQSWSFTASTTSFFVTFWHRQTIASSASSPTSASPPLPPRKRSPGTFLPRLSALDRVSSEK